MPGVDEHIDLFLFYGHGDILLLLIIDRVC